MSDLRNKLKHRLIDLNMSQTEFAEKLGIHKQVVASWMTGKRNPKMESIKKMSKILKIPFSYLTDDTKNNFIEQPVEKQNCGNSDIILKLIEKQNNLIEENKKRFETEISLLKKDMEIFRRDLELLKR